jgi:DNA-binding NtrC family response regulator
MYSVLIVGLEREARHRLSAVIERYGLTARTAGTVAKACTAMNNYAMTAVLIDCGVDGASGLQALATLPLKPNQVVIFLADDTDGALAEAIESSDSAMFELLPRDPDDAELDRVFHKVKRVSAMRKARVSNENKPFESMLGNSPEMLEVYNMIAKVAPTDASVLICGESGTGKELVAGAIHSRSERSGGPFVAVNCGAIAENLIESELFGHEKGAFTGADKSHAGVFEQADGGTLFLDEITEMPLEVQVRFLRVLETGTLRRLGAEKDTKVSVRVVAATNREPKEAVKQGAFREDLMYRLAVFPISLPPLRDRGDDAILLASHFLSMHNKAQKTEKRLTKTARQKLTRYDWPGNVRQLRNLIQRAYILEGAEMNLDCLDDLLDDAETGTCGDAVNRHQEKDADERPTGDEGLHTDSDTASSQPQTDADTDAVVMVEVGTTIDEAEKQLILKTLEELDGNKTEAAKVLGISLKTLYNRLNDYDI